MLLHIIWLLAFDNFMIAVSFSTPKSQYFHVVGCCSSISSALPVNLTNELSSQLRRQALASLHSGLQNGQGIPISQVVEWLAMEVSMFSSFDRN